MIRIRHGSRLITIVFIAHLQEIRMHFPSSSRKLATLCFLLASQAVSFVVSISPAEAAPRLQVEESIAVAARPAEVWKLVGDFRGVDDWHPAVATSNLVKGTNNTQGAVRSITTKDGATIVEELLAFNGKEYSMRYRIVESPLPVNNYVATLSVRAEGKGSRLVWKSRFERNAAPGVDDTKVREIIAGIYRAGFDGLRTRLAGSGSVKN
jgi:mxaD protein